MSHPSAPSRVVAAGRSPQEGYLAARVLDALLREDYGGLARRVDGDSLALPGGRSVALSAAAPGDPGRWGRYTRVPRRARRG